MIRKRNIIGWLIVASPIYMGIAFATYFLHWAQTPLPLVGETLITLHKNTSLITFSEELEQRDLIHNPSLFRLWLKAHSGTYERFQAGTYRFVDPVSPKDIITAMVDGKTYNPLVFEFIIPEGSTFRQIQEKLIYFGIGTEAEFNKIARDKKFMTSLGIKGFEGFLYPVTYKFFTTKPTAREVLERAVKEFFVRIPDNYGEELRKRGLDIDQWVAFASLIERETPWDEEKRLIAEVIWRRLKARMTLGIDASLIYGIPDFDGDFTKEHLQDASNRYNSRIHRGLPPTPIASPSLSSLLAVLRPTEEGYYYFVLVPGGEKRHHFSKSLKEHNVFVRHLVQYQKSNMH